MQSYYRINKGEKVKIKGLTHLNLSFKNIRELEIVSNVLEKLNLHNNQLTSFDGSGLSNLKTLYLSNNQLTSFDGSWLSNLKTLDLYNNQLTFIYTTIN
ncbi:E3 ubiquitin-protein ligase SlrP [Tenacibaculum phage PTm1]|uniref:E3 ubiquitin-protein ligase SlrP n=2 Tax=Shirahamavirus PTm1 TaxID=2846435 RepID=A0A5S9BZ75_9CAUD|nr:E3 ubiquitin-protein ligase SlrP [Tenacibaculum phage PTm1]BBI90681.1 E3 ubiquitin-protein ligase SlrP [Tenacibaculum phage PTm1]